MHKKELGYSAKSPPALPGKGAFCAGFPAADLRDTGLSLFGVGGGGVFLCGKLGVGVLRLRRFGGGLDGPEAHPAPRSLSHTKKALVPAAAWAGTFAVVP